ncbi:MAG: acyl-CoA thioesterase [Bacteroidia bacterium]|nr:acyl-CoA thioesterase [Bacteroidia bacterium]
MYTHETQIRVRYSETDKMDYVYYGNYATYFEVGRVEAMRSLGMPYKSIEDQGILMPVLEFTTKFIKPSYYDDLLKIKTTIEEIPAARIKFKYEVFNDKEELVTLGHTTLVFIDEKFNKPCRAPAELIEKLEQYL